MGEMPDAYQPTVDRELDLMRSIARQIEADPGELDDDERAAMLALTSRLFLKLDRRITGGHPLPTSWQDVDDARTMNVHLTVEQVEDILEGLEGALDDAQSLVVEAERSDYDRDRTVAEQHHDGCQARLERVKAFLPSVLV